MKTDTLQPLMIPLSEAQDWVRAWQKNFPECAKAFLIPVPDLVHAFMEMGVVTENTDGSLQIKEIPDAAVRGYIGLNPKKDERSFKNGYGNKLYIVGTRKEGDIYKDIVVDDQPSPEATGLTGSGIFDFTHPCPSDCDPGSPLANPN